MQLTSCFNQQANLQGNRRTLNVFYKALQKCEAFFLCDNTKHGISFYCNKTNYKK